MYPRITFYHHKNQKLLDSLETLHNQIFGRERRESRERISWARVKAVRGDLLTATATSPSSGQSSASNQLPPLSSSFLFFPTRRQRESERKSERSSNREGLIAEHELEKDPLKQTVCSYWESFMRLELQESGDPVVLLLICRCRWLLSVFGLLLWWFTAANRPAGDRNSSSRFPVECELKYPSL